MPIISARNAEYSNVDWIPTGIAKLDAALGGGIPTKRITEISGPYSSGKTSLALLAMASGQERGYTAIWNDQEWAWEPSYAEKIGVDLDTLLLLQEKHAEESLDALEQYLEGHKNVIVTIDAVGAILPRQEAEKGSGEKTIGGQAVLIAKFCRKVVPLLALNNSALLVINHQFTDIMTGALKTSGGAKLEYHKSIAVSLKRKYGATAKRASDGKIFEVVVEAEIRKNKLAGTLGTKVDLFMEPGSGFLIEGDLFQQVLDAGIISQIKSTFYYADEKLGTRKKAKEWIGIHKDELQSSLKGTD